MPKSPPEAGAIGGGYDRYGIDFGEGFVNDGLGSDDGGPFLLEKNPFRFLKAGIDVASGRAARAQVSPAGYAKISGDGIIVFCE